LCLLHYEHVKIYLFELSYIIQKNKSC
jgi:hypothetical protein